MVGVSVVIPTLDGGDRLDSVLDAVMTQEGDDFDEIEIVCVDSGSRPPMRKRLDRKDVRVIDIPRGSFDHGATRRLGIENTRGEFVALLTQDARPADTRWLAPLIDALRRDSEAAGAWSRQLVRPGADPLERWKMHHWSGSKREARRAGLPEGEGWDDLDPRRRYQVALFDDVSCCIRRSDWQRIPHRPVEFGEDLDWGRRVVEAGRRILFVPESRVVHSHPARTWSDARRVFADHRNIIRLTGWRTVPTLGTVPRAAIGGLLDMTRFVWRTSPPSARPGPLVRSIPYALGLAAAQWAASAKERAAR
ncbi:MAG: hypothetical protein CME06_03550 [Gemmatimonadetes bacterium]|nr:hypothetical protein [Gemmatimonadota bacterium]